MKKLIIIILALFSINIVAQNSDVKTFSYTFKTIEFNSVFLDSDDGNFSLYNQEEFNDTLKFDIKTLNDSYNTFVFTDRSFEYKDYTNYFTKQCGALKDGVTVDYNAKNEIVSSVLNNALNNYVIRKLFFKKKN